MDSPLSYIQNNTSSYYIKQHAFSAQAIFSYLNTPLKIFLYNALRTPHLCLSKKYKKPGNTANKPLKQKIPVKKQKGADGLSRLPFSKISVPVITVFCRLYFR